MSQLDNILDVQEADNKEVSGKRLQLIVFKLGNEEYALSIEQIKEVVITPSIAKIPQTPEYIKGVANIRGTVIAIMDLEQKFGLINDEDENGESNSANYTLVIESDELKVGVLVKQVPNTLSVYESEIDQSGNIIKQSSLDENCIEGIVKYQDQMIILIDMIKLLNSNDLKKIVKQ